jgi:hypothetical protein
MADACSTHREERNVQGVMGGEADSRRPMGRCYLVTLRMVLERERERG